jgi:diguanylate cyclase (GGDEF)-like protein
MPVPAQVLVVDDEAVARNLYSDVLIAAGHTVRAVASSNEALAAFDEERFDVVVTDLILPGKDGMHLLTEFKRKRPEVEIIVVTALEKVEPAVRALKNGASEYLVKPLAPEVLQAAVSRCLLTQKLLTENNALRAHVALLEAGQKIATTLDRATLYPLVLDALERELSPEASMVLVQTGAVLNPSHHRNLTDEQVKQLAQAIANADTSSDAKTNGDATTDAAQSQPLRIPLGDRTALVFPAREGHDTLGALAVIAPRRRDAAGLSAATFLANHMGLALRNSGRIAAVEDLAYQDDLTGLFNTRYLHLVLERELKRALSTGEPLALLFMDLDRFKTVNDHFGHLAGSKLLVEAARVLLRCVRECDVVVRYGGDEYVVLLQNTDAQGGLKVAERIRRGFEEHTFLAQEGQAVKLSVCIGVASFPEHAADKQTLLLLADSALFQGKRTTRNVVYVADPARLLSKASSE